METFGLTEFKALRAEILYQIQTIDSIKFWIAAAMAAYYSFVIAKFVVLERDRVILTGPIWMWAAPAVLPVLGFLRLQAHIAQLDLFGTYIREHLEKQIFKIEAWEHFYHQHRLEDTVWIYDKYYFLALFVFACAIVFVRLRSVPTPPEPETHKATVGR